MATKIPERKGKPAHVASLPSLPEVNSAFIVVLHLLFILTLGRLSGHPVPTEEDVTFVIVEHAHLESNITYT